MLHFAALSLRSHACNYSNKEPSGIMNLPKFGLLSYPRNANLGDAIQSLAARRFLPQVDCHVAREEISEKPAIDVNIRLICNGWFMHQPAYWPPHPKIQPLLVSMHFAETDFDRFQRFRARPLDQLLVGQGAEYLRQWGPVGGRDEFSVEQLEAHGIPAYLSGCLTLTLQRPKDAARGDYIVACDLPVAQLEHLMQVSKRPVIVVTHKNARYETPEQQEEAAQQLLALYAGAAAVITTRIHAALPCLAFDTPVLLIEQAQGRRVSDMRRLIHSCQGSDFLFGRHDFDLECPPDNPQDFRPLAAALETRCREFVS